MNDLFEIQKDVNELLAWKASKEDQQITYPLDVRSTKVLHKIPGKQSQLVSGSNGIQGPLICLKTDLVGPPILTDFLGFGLGISIINQYATFLPQGSVLGDPTLTSNKYFLYACPVLKQFGVDPVTDIISTTDGAHNLHNGDRIALATDNIIPGGLSVVEIYYVINASGATFKVSLTSGGTPVDIIDVGNGNHYYGLL